MQYTKHNNINLDSLFNKIGSIKPKGNAKLEIEARYFIDERKKANIYCTMYNIEKTIDIAKKLIEKYKDKPASVSQTINFVAADNIKQMSFINGEQQKDKLTHYSKTKIINPMMFTHNTLPMYRFSVSFETPIAEFPVASSTLARIRLRYTILITDEWQLDLTLVKSVNDLSNPAKLKSAKSQMFYPIDTDTFVEKAPWQLADIIEFELEYIGKKFTTADLLEANNVFDFIEAPGSTKTDGSYQETIKQIAKWIRPQQANKIDGLERLSNRVIELDKNMFLRDIMLDISDYYITDKIDGYRAILYIANGTCNVITKELTTFPLETANVYILDCEEYKDHYYIFDVMVFDGVSYVNKPFKERLALFENVTKLSKKLKSKPFEKLTDSFQEQIREFKTAQLKKPYETDGVILTPSSGLYVTMQVYKYKPIDKLSIDFVIKKCPDSLLGISPYVAKPKQTLYLLFSGMSRHTFKQLNLKFIRNYEDVFPGVDLRHPPDYFSYQFQPSNYTYAYLYWDEKDTLDGLVGEFLCTECIQQNPYTIKDNIWTLHKIRSDKTMGNNFKVAELAWMTYKDPLVIEDLDNSDLYFQQHNNELQKASRHFNSFVKGQILGQFKGTEWVMDLASGKGQDLFRYAGHAYKNAIFLEINNTALLELVHRKYDLKNTNPMNIQLHQIDMTHDYKENIQKLTDDICIPTLGVDMIVCNFAFHYFLADNKSLKNVIKFIGHYLKPGGRFVFTAFDGRAIVQLLNENSGNWTVMKGNEIKYSIKKEYKTTLLESLGQQINVLLPFSNNTYYTEYLVNIDHIAEEFGKTGFTLEIDESFSEHLPSYKSQNSKGFYLMDEDDKKYSSLYHHYCFYKKKVGGNKKR